jgi:L-lysine 2,3-aminomutase
LTKYRDDVCKVGECVNVKVCKGLCPLLKGVNGRSCTKEKLLSEVSSIEVMPYKDYKDVISEYAEDYERKQEKRHDHIISILQEENSRNKLVKFAALMGYPKEEIADFFCVSVQQVYRIIKKS